MLWHLTDNRRAQLSTQDEISSDTADLRKQSAPKVYSNGVVRCEQRQSKHGDSYRGESTKRLQGQKLGHVRHEVAL